MKAVKRSLETPELCPCEQVEELAMLVDALDAAELAAALADKALGWRLEWRRAAA